MCRLTRFFTCRSRNAEHCHRSGFALWKGDGVIARIESDWIESDWIETEEIAKVARQIGISTRQSTAIFAVEDPEIRHAANLIREQACAGITVIDVLRGISWSRRVFESRFRNATGQTPREAILSRCLKWVERWLRESDLSF